MILRPRFYDPVNMDRAAERQRLGLDPCGLPVWYYSAARARNVMLDIAAEAP